MIPKKIYLIGVSVLLAPIFLLSQYAQRSLLEKSIFFINNGKIESAKYWSVPIGKASCKLAREFAGEGKVTFDAEMNFALLSSGYIEGNGYGTRGKCGAEAQFILKETDSVNKQIDLGDIDYVYENGAKVRLKNGISADLLVKCEGNVFTISSMDIMIWIYDNTFKELKHSKDISGISAFAFTKEGAARALKTK